MNKVMILITVLITSIISIIFLGIINDNIEAIGVTPVTYETTATNVDKIAYVDGVGMSILDYENNNLCTYANVSDYEDITYSPNNGHIYALIDTGTNTYVIHEYDEACQLVDTTGAMTLTGASATINAMDVGLVVYTSDLELRIMGDTEGMPTLLDSSLTSDSYSYAVFNYTEILLENLGNLETWEFNGVAMEKTNDYSSYTPVSGIDYYTFNDTDLFYVSNTDHQVMTNRTTLTDTYDVNKTTPSWFNIYYYENNKLVILNSDLDFVIYDFDTDTYTLTMDSPRNASTTSIDIDNVNDYMINAYTGYLTIYDLTDGTYIDTNYASIDGATFIDNVNSQIIPLVDAKEVTTVYINGVETEDFNLDGDNLTLNYKGSIAYQSPITVEYNQVGGDSTLGNVLSIIPFVIITSVIGVSIYYIKYT